MDLHLTVAFDLMGMTLINRLINDCAAVAALAFHSEISDKPTLSRYFYIYKQGNIKFTTKTWGLPSPSHQHASSSSPFCGLETRDCKLLS